MGGHHGGTTTPEDLLIGAHTSAAGGVHKAILHGADIGATTIQLFTANQRQWSSSSIPEEEVERWQQTLKDNPLKGVMSHDSYLINLGSPNPELLEKSRKAFALELKRCHQLGLAYLNFHPGTATDGDVEGCLKRICKSLLSVADLASQGKTRLLVETTAGQGSVVGSSFEEIAAIIHPLADEMHVGVCIDTCHIFAAGYDIRTKEGWETTLHEFGRTVGLKHLFALHVNDSMKPLGSRRDRHASLGEGEIGIDSFKAMMQNPHLTLLPKYLETPNPDIWKDEIKALRNYARSVL